MHQPLITHTDWAGDREMPLFKCLERVSREIHLIKHTAYTPLVTGVTPTWIPPCYTDILTRRKTYLANLLNDYCAFHADPIRISLLLSEIDDIATLVSAHGSAPASHRPAIQLPTGIPLKDNTPHFLWLPDAQTLDDLANYRALTEMQWNTRVLGPLVSLPDLKTNHPYIPPHLISIRAHDVSLTADTTLDICIEPIGDGYSHIYSTHFLNGKISATTECDHGKHVVLREPNATHLLFARLEYTYRLTPDHIAHYLRDNNLPDNLRSRIKQYLEETLPANPKPWNELWPSRKPETLAERAYTWIKRLFKMT